MSDTNQKTNEKKWSSSTKEEQENIYANYQAQGQYCTEIIKSMADKLFSWFFILNTGGLLGVMTLISATISKHDICSLYLVILLGMIFFTGIICSVIAVIYEQHRFIKKGEQLENNFDKLQNDQLTIAEFTKRSFSTYSSKKIWRLEKASFICFSIGFLFSCYIVINVFT